MRGLHHRLAAAALLLGLAATAAPQPAGDPTPGSLAPVTIIVNPTDGAVVAQTIRVQARVQHPAGLAQVPSVNLSVTGATLANVPLARNPRYAPPGGGGIFEAVITLEAGGAALAVTATDTSGRSTRSPIVNVEAKGTRGDGNLLVRDNASELCAACHAHPDHGSEVVGRAHGAWTTTCRDCHTPHATRNASLMREAIAPPWLAGAAAPAARPVRFATRRGFAEAGGDASWGAASFANGDGTGPCQVCHTRTAYWRSDGAASASHSGACGFCHRHSAGLAPMACDSCHAVPPGTGAHAAHQGAAAPSPPFPSDPRPLGCGNCHPTDPLRHGDGGLQVTLNTKVVLPGGTTTAGAARGGLGVATTCLVACHFPLGAPVPARPVAWGATGPLPCTSCHSRINPGGAAPTPRAGPSLHDPVFSEARPPSGEPTTCHSCHDAAAHAATHLTGAPGLVGSAAVDAACVGCHTPPSGPAAGPPGQVLHAGADAAGSRTPPVLPGWSTATVDAATGDFHGGRRGTCFGPYGPGPCSPTATPTGFGGTLKAPWVRGQGALPCATCHAGHASGNAFLLADAVNGVAIPPGTIDRTGVGAERLCEACHEGGRHDRCVECHTDAYFCDQNAQCWMDPAANHVDPAPPGSACFFCHGHEGIVKWTSPFGPHGDPPTDCTHCHSGLVYHGTEVPPLTVPPDFAAPTLPWGPPVVSNVTATSAVVTWRTSERATTFVEFGVGLPGYVAGNGAEVQDHAVTLAGLAPATTYVWRIRSVDAQRNVLRTALAAFATYAADAVPAPDVVPTGWAGAPSPQTTVVTGLVWFPVPSPTGNPLQYRVQLASDPSFAGLANGAPADSGWIAGSATTSGGKAALTFAVTLTNLPIDQCTEEVPFNQYYWRVKARDATTGKESAWSAVDPFRANSYDPWGC